MQLNLAVNHARWQGEVPVRLTLADFLRDRLKLWGTHLGCEQGVCGACTVLVEGQAVRSCLMLAVQAEGAHVETVEGMGNPGQPSRLQRAFVDRRAFQCGFCTAGFLASGEALLRSGRRYTRDQLQELLAGNVCRCTAYGAIVEAIHSCQEAG